MSLSVMARRKIRQLLSLVRMVGEGSVRRKSSIKLVSSTRLNMWMVSLVSMEARHS